MVCRKFCRSLWWDDIEIQAKQFRRCVTHRADSISLSGDGFQKFPGRDTQNVWKGVLSTTRSVELNPDDHVIALTSKIWPRYHVTTNPFYITIKRRTQTSRHWSIDKQISLLKNKYWLATRGPMLEGGELTQMKKINFLSFERAWPRPAPFYG